MKILLRNDRVAVDGILINHAGILLLIVVVIAVARRLREVETSLVPMSVEVTAGRKDEGVPVGINFDT